MTRVDELTSQIMKEITKVTDKLDHWVNLWEDDEISECSPDGDDFKSKKKVIQELVESNRVEGSIFKGVDFEADDTGVYYINVYFMTKPKLFYKSGKVYVSKITPSGAFEFTTKIKEAFDFADWSYKELFLCDFFSKGSGKFLVVRGGKNRFEPKLFSGVKDYE